MTRDLTGQHHKINYIEFPVTDIERAKGFYGAAFGWTFKDYGPEYCEFSDGTLFGGLIQVDKVAPGGTLVVLYSDDLDASQRAVEAAGGVIDESMDFPGGKRFHFTDPDGNKLAVWAKC